MKYLLGIGFATVEKYKKDPVARVSIDDTFVDEIIIDDYPNYDQEWPGHANLWPHKSDSFVYDNKGGRVNNTDGKFKRLLLVPGCPFPKKFRTYVLDENRLKGKKQLIVKMHNSDSNFNNGFMTKSTLLDFYAFLLPLKLIKLFKKDGETQTNDFIKDIVDPEFKGKFNMLAKGLTMSSQNKAGENQEVGPRKADGYPFAWKIFWNGEEHTGWSIGGNGTLRAQLLTKTSGTVMFDPYDGEVLKLQREKKVMQDTGFYISEKFFSLAHQKVFDKYLHNEDQ